MNPSSPKPPRKLRLSSALVLICIWVALLVLIGYNRQNISDWWKLRSYNAPTAVAQLATNDTMTNKARRILYVNEPQLQLKANFNECNLGTEQAAILGCYRSNQDGIFVLQVADPRLSGIEQVTAAHEMLHAAYDRLSSKQKKTIDAQLEDYYEHDLHDPTILAQMAGYKKSEPNAVVNEMHSVFGTEVANLPPALEKYYQQYFTSRAKIVGYYDQYQSEFTTREATVKADDLQLASLKTQIDTEQNTLKAQYGALQTQQSQLTTYKQNGEIAQYNAGVPGYNASVVSYNAQVDAVQALVTQYNQLVNSRNSVALETQQLSNEITTQATPIGQ